MTPFSHSLAQSVGSLNETTLISCIHNWLGRATPPPPAGIGDDCAVLPAVQGSPLLTIDPVVYGKHFDDSLPPEQVAAKLLKRNLSDIAAMGGRPHAAVLGLMLSANLSMTWLERFFEGLKVSSLTYKTHIVGGDICSAEGRTFAATLTLYGEASRPVQRLGGQPGDRVAVTGHLGGSLLGKHAAFIPRLTEGQWLAARPEVKAMMDLTDGLAKDLPAMLPPQACARLDTASVPLDEAAGRMAERSGQSPLYHACCDGEDYELLVILDGQADLSPLLEAWSRDFDLPLTLIGKFADASPETDGHLTDAANGNILFPRGGYQHLSGQ
ncbi:thiamine-monophosphate kinase [Ruficoccus amylovorans]|uniref:Thiamine-monophosphate kinase n=1 Tax=Ruficoccus amylovorans TaxID=1804625 RepID=A0A842HE79_9BACT|nr:thiamine-phosphate kinase [Ruficoccus amylovorans]MBC2594823.1 thiamine-monophosphate kinase [Ruficoccus amylovorans]